MPSFHAGDAEGEESKAKKEKPDVSQAKTGRKKSTSKKKDAAAAAGAITPGNGGPDGPPLTPTADAVPVQKPMPDYAKGKIRLLLHYQSQYFTPRRVALDVSQ